MSRHSRHAAMRGRHRKTERIPFVQSLRDSPKLAVFGAFSIVLGFSTLGTATAEMSAAPATEFIWPTHCPASDPAKINTWRKIAQRAFANNAIKPHEYRVDTPERLAAKYKLKIIDASPAIDKLSATKNPAQAVNIANEYTYKNFGITTTTGTLNKETPSEAMQLLHKFDQTPAALIDSARVDNIVIQSPRPQQKSPNGRAFIEWEASDPTDPGTIELGPGQINDSIGHEMHHGSDRQRSFMECATPDPVEDLDIQNANPPGFTYSDYPRYGQWEGTTVNRYAATSPFEDAATIAQAAIYPDATDWKSIATRPIIDKMAVIAMRYEEDTPGLGKWVLANASTQPA